MTKDLIPGLFSFRGRMGRGEFWLLLVGLSVVSGLFLMLASMLVLMFVSADKAETLAPLHALGKTLIQLLTLWPSLAILTKRGHDRDRPAALSIGLWLVSVASFLIGGFMLGMGGSPIASLVGVAIWLYFLVDYGFIAGTPGANRYDFNRPKRKTESAARAAALFD